MSEKHSKQKPLPIDMFTISRTMLLLTVLSELVGINGDLSSVSNVHLESILARGAQIEWDYSNYSAGIVFDVQYKKLGEIYWRHLENYGTTLFLAPLDHGETYDLQIRARKGQETSAWSDSFIFKTPGPSPSLPIISPPSDLKVAVISPTSVHLRWTSNVPLTVSVDMYYVVRVTEMNANGEMISDKQIFVKAKTFLLEPLKTASTYRFQVKIHMGRDESLYSEAVSVRLPSSSELFAVTNVSISYSDSVPGFVNVTWIIPERFLLTTTAFVVWFSINKESDEWNHVLVEGNVPKATIGPLPSNAIVYFSIETHFVSGINTESNVFQFQTPSTNPIDTVDVVYSEDITSLRLRWKLKENVDTNTIFGYEIVLTKDQNIPENLWTRFYIQGAETTMQLNDLDPATLYFAKIYIRKPDGRSIPTSTLYQFLTLREASAVVEYSINMAYQRVSPESIKVKWTFPASFAQKNLTGTMVLYTSEPLRPEKEWMKIMVPANRFDVLITGLAADKTYFLKVLPRDATSTMPIETGTFKILPSNQTTESVKTDLMIANKIDNVTTSETHEEARVLCFRACHATDDCASNEKCTMIDSSMGFCIPTVLYEAIKRYNPTSS